MLYRIDRSDMRITLVELLGMGQGRFYEVPFLMLYFEPGFNQDYCWPIVA
jgi:hypothetical protein